MKIDNSAKALALAALVRAGKAGGGADADYTDFRRIASNVRRGLGPYLYPVGTQLICEKETAIAATLGTHTGISACSVNEETFLAAIGNAGTGIHEFVYDGSAWHYGEAAVSLTHYGISVTGTPANGDTVVVTETLTELVWDVVHHYTPDGGTPRMVLLLHNCWYNRPFDAAEATWAFADGLEAGEYHFTYDNTEYHFTTTEAIPAGGVIKMTYPGSGTDLAGQTITCYAADRTTVIQTKSITSGLTGTDIDEFGSANSSGGYGNNVSRFRYGSNNYKESDIRQWLNSNATKGNWWSPRTMFDMPSAYKTEAGFMHGMDVDFLNAVLPTEVKCGTNNTWELYGWTLNSAYTVTDKFFLASRPEVGFGAESMDQGSVWDFYKNATNADRIKRDFGGTARDCWLRGPYPSYAYYVRFVGSDGSLNSFSAGGGISGAPACEIG